MICQPALISKISITTCSYFTMTYALLMNLPFLNRMVTLNCQYLFIVPQ